MISSNAQIARLDHDEVHSFPTHFGRTVRCRVRIVETRWHVVVVTSDMSEDIESSITLHTEEIASAIGDMFELADNDRLIWIEHIPSRPGWHSKKDLYDLVHFDRDRGTLQSPFWTPLEAEELTLLTEGMISEMNGDSRI